MNSLLPFILIGLLFLVSLGIFLGLIVGQIVRFLLREKRNRIIADAILGVLAAFLGNHISFWAWTHADNTGMRRKFILWDEDGQLIHWRTALAENELILALMAALALIMFWHLTAMVLAKRRKNHGQWHSSSETRSITKPCS
jgi:uncharacterized membrane protein YeaQ/YmgE (transglycosylase-associated protein family)